MILSLATFFFICIIFIDLNAFALPFIDFHNHSRWNRGADIIEVTSIHGLQKKDYSFYTFGYHPWWTLDLLSDEELTAMSTKYLNDPLCLGLGEFGLDNLKGASIDVQEQIFSQQISIANNVKSPVIIHCVRAYDRLIRLRREFGQTPWTVHGFVRNKILAGQLLDAGMNLSVAPHHERGPSFVEMIAYVPMENVFIETDSDFSMNITDRYTIFAAIKKMDVQDVQEILYSNFITFYKDKWKHHIG